MNKIDQSTIKLAKRYKIDIDSFDSVWDAIAELCAREDYLFTALMKQYNEKCTYRPQTEIAIDNWKSGEENSIIDYYLDEYIHSNTKKSLDRNSTLGVGDIAEIAQVSTSTTDEITKAMKKLQGVISSDEVVSPNVARIKELANQLADTYARKNKDYGDSFGISVARYGIIAALTRMSDKWNRLENLILHNQDRSVNDESVLDTLLDLAAYALMTYMEVEKGE